MDTTSATEHKSAVANRPDNVETKLSTLAPAPRASFSHLNHPRANSYSPRLFSESSKSRKPPAASLARRQTHPTTSTVQKRRTGCSISLCRTPRCRLQTHLHHQSSTQESPTKIFAQSPTFTSPFTTSNALEDIPIQALHFPIQDDFNSLPKILADAFDESRLWVLYKTFYTRDFQHMNTILSPPPFTEAEKAKLIISKEESVRITISDALYCLNVICSTFLRTSCDEQPFGLDRFFSQLHGKALHLFRAKLNNFAPDEVDQLVPVIFMLVRVDLGLGNLEMMESHRKILSHLVTSRGGPYNFDVKTIPLLIDLDLIIAACVGLKPLFSFRIDRSFQSKSRHAAVYGHGLVWQLPESEFDQNIVNYCQDVCRAVEIMEMEKWNFSTEELNRDVNVGNIYYFYFLRNRLSVESTHLQSWDFPLVPKSRPVLLAASLVAYLTLQDGYVAHFPLVLADLLKTTLEQYNLRKDWVGRQEIIRWILCVVFSIPIEWSGQTWAFSVFQKILDRTYAHGFWPPNWAAVEVQNARRFVWSDTRLTDTLLINFRKLELSKRKALQSDGSCRLTGRTGQVPLHRHVSDLGLSTTESC